MLLLTVAGMMLTGGAASFYVASVDVPAGQLIPQASVLYYRDGVTVLARIGTNNRTDVALSQVPTLVQRAVLAAEDRDFYGHVGVSASGVVRAAWVNVARGRTEGASTITQQYVRNAFLTQRQTLHRKVMEAALALRLERGLTKDQILEGYLNTIYFGRGAYGIQAAAHAYFGVTVDRLTLSQGAVLAAVIKDPTQNDPAVNSGLARGRWRWILQAMAAHGWLDGATAASMEYPWLAPSSRTAAAIAGPLGLIVDQVQRELRTKGITPQVLHTGGLKVITTIDVTAQTAATAAVSSALRDQPKQLRAALVAVDPATGAVRAYYGGNQGSGYFDDATAPRAPASVFKPLVLAEGLRQGISYRSRWDGSSPRNFRDRQGVPLQNASDEQCPDCTLDRAMVRSLHTPFYALAQRVGPRRVRDLAVAMGIPERYGKQRSLVDLKGEPTPGRTRADIALGRYAVAPADLASVYATLAAGGVRTDRHLVHAVSGPGDDAWHTEQSRRRVLTAAVAADVSAVLRAVTTVRGPVPGRSAAAMTGTRPYRDDGDSQDAWTAGFVPQLAAVAWIGRAQPGPINDHEGKPVRGEGMPYAIWRAFLTAALRGEPNVDLPAAAHVGQDDLGDVPSHTHRQLHSSSAPQPSKAPTEAAPPSTPAETAPPRTHTETPSSTPTETASPSTPTESPASTPTETALPGTAIETDPPAPVAPSSRPVVR